MNKSTKIRLNYLFGITLSVVLLYSLYQQVAQQLESVDLTQLFQSQAEYFLMITLLLMPVNLMIEGYKWKVLVNSAQTTSYGQAFASVLGGVALSIITPNRIGELPGRILYMQRKNTIRLISVAILSAFTQFFTLFLFGIAGLVYYNRHNPGNWQGIVLSAAVLILLFIAIVFFRFEDWARRFEHLRWLRKFNTYNALMQRFTRREQLNVLGLSILRFLVFTAQYLLLLRWMNIPLSFSEGLFTAFLFFWAIAVIPSFALAELGIRGQVSLFLFHNFSNNTMGILVATLGLWFINLVIPALVGSVMLIRMRWLR